MSEEKKFEDFGIYGVNYAKKKYGDSDQVRLKCPRCAKERRTKKGQKELSLSVNTKDGVWNCFHCGWKGSLHEKKWNSPSIVSHEVKKPEIISFFEKRKISEKTLAKMRVGQFFDHYNNYWISFDYYENGAVVFGKYRKLSEKRFYTSGKETKPVFYNQDALHNYPSIIITEGEIDCLSLIEAGFNHAVSLPMGASALDAVINENYDLLLKKDKIYLAIDSDSKGIECEGKLLNVFGKHKCLKIEYPGGLKDINEVLMLYGLDEVKKCVLNAKPYPMSGIYSIGYEGGDLESDLDDARQNGRTGGATIGFDKMDQHFHFMPGQLTVVTGYAGHGKSNWVAQMCCRLAVKHDWAWGVLSAEDNPKDILFERWAKIITGKRLYVGESNAMSDSEYDEVKEFLSNHLFCIRSDNDDFTFDEVEKRALNLIQGYDIRGLVIDPWDMIVHERVKSESETEYIAKALKRIRLFAQSTGLHIILVAHPTKPIKDRGTNVYVSPDLHSISGSRTFSSMADNGMSVHRHQDAETGQPLNSCDVIILKVKHSYFGKLGKISFNFQKSNERYTEIGFEDYHPSLYGPEVLEQRNGNDLREFRDLNKGESSFKEKTLKELINK